MSMCNPVIREEGANLGRIIVAERPVCGKKAEGVRDEDSLWILLLGGILPKAAPVRESTLR